MNDLISKWDDSPVKFRDPPRGYVEIPKIYVKNLIDSVYIQRIKGVAQTGIKPLFPTATHDRFCHSLGVYRYAMLAYDSLCEAIRADAKDRLVESPNFFKSIEFDLKLWRELLGMASLLHDIGHPIGSHSFEFLYDDIFMLLYPNKPADLRDENNHKSQIKSTTEIRNKVFESNDENADYVNSLLKRELFDLLKLNSWQDLKGHPHERMSAYMILSKAIPENGGISLYEAIEKTIWAFIDFHEEDYEKLPNKKTREELISESVNFICRMITGQYYSPAYSHTFKEENYRKSAMDCVISILNGSLDADSIDYTMRNAYYGGYAAHQVDFDRLCAAFTVYKCGHTLRPCFKKSAISVIEGFIIARNAEPKWLYSHHKVVYHDVLTKHLFYYIAKYLCFRDIVDNGIKLMSGTNPAGIGFASAPDSADGYTVDLSMTQENIDDFCDFSHHPYYAYILAPIVRYTGTLYNFYGSNDATLDSLIRDLSIRLSHDKIPPVNELASRIFSQNDHEILKDLINEYMTRQFKKSLWKSGAEYEMLIVNIAKDLGVSPNIVREFILTTVKKMRRIQFNLQEQDDKVANELYQKEYIYRYIPPPPTEKSDTRTGEELQKMAMPSETKIFDMEGFRYPNCVCKIFKGRFKEGLGKLCFKMGSRDDDIIELSEIKPELLQNTYMEFPYIYLKPHRLSGEKDKTDDEVIERMRADFAKRLAEYCGQQIRRESAVLKEDNMSKNPFRIRDVIHGDIELSETFLKVVETPEFQRLLRIKQLALTSSVFPSANHTRFEHSLGTFHIMKKVVAHFRDIFKDMGTEPKDDDSDIALLAALVHDIGHGPFSHAFENICNVKHEEWTKRIILESPGLHNAISQNFGKNAPQRVVDCINAATGTPDKYENLNFSLIYSEIVSGALDVDRMDFIPRDAYYTASKFGSIDISRIVSAITITSIEGKYCLCFEDSSLSYLEQFIFARREMYKNVYFTPLKVKTETLVQAIIRRAIDVRDVLDERECDLLEKLGNFDGKKMTVAEYVELDDHMMYTMFMNWRSSSDVILEALCRALVDVSVTDNRSFEYIDYIDDNNTACKVDDFFAKVREITDIIYHKSLEKTEGFAFLMGSRHSVVYPIKDDTTDKSAGKLIKILETATGSSYDFGNIRGLSGGSIPIYCRYVYWNEMLLRTELENKGNTKESVDLRIEQVREFMDNCKPRKNIEIEYKFSCGKEAFEEIEAALLCKDAAGCIKEEGFQLINESKGFEPKKHKDKYFDTPAHDFRKDKKTLRLRDNRSTMKITVKSQNESENYWKGSPLARNEFEYKVKTADKSLPPEEIRDKYKDSILPKLDVSSDVLASSKPVLEVRNNRKVGKLGKAGADGFSCDICLDSFTFFDPITDTESETFYQIELELTSEKYLSRVMLDRFQELMSAKIKGLHPVDESKYEIGMNWLESCEIKS